MHRRLVTLAFAARAFATTAHAQTEQHAALRVTVLDPTGAVIVGAAVSVEPAGSSEPLTGVTDGRGDAVFAPLAAGRYRLRITADGFETATIADVRVSGSDVRRRVTLALARVQEALTVRDDVD